MDPALWENSQRSHENQRKWTQRYENIAREDMKIRENTDTENNFLWKANQADTHHHSTIQPDQYQQNNGHQP